MKLLLPIFCFLLFHTPVVTAKMFKETPDVEIVRAEFGVYKNIVNKRLFVPVNTVPLIVGQEYGWRVEIKTKKPMIKWREEFTLPAAPVTWGNVEHTVLKDRRVSVMEREVSTSEGIILNTWSVAKGDPAGRYILRVLIDEQYEQLFVFDVQSPVKKLSK